VIFKFRSFARLTRAGFVLARAGVFNDVDATDLPGVAKVGLSLAKLIARRQTGPSLDALPGAMSKLGPSYIKLGQFLSTRPDVVGPAVVKQLEKLQDRAAPFSRDIALAEITAAFGRPWDSIFLEVGEPVAAASIAQVHKARVRDDLGERDVAVKIRRPGVERLLRRDLADMAAAARFIETAFPETRRLKPADVVTHATTGSGPSASFLGSDMRAAYYGGTALTGAGQNLGLFEYAGTDLADLSSYFSSIGQTNNVPVTLYSVDGTSTACEDSSAGGSCDDTEQTLDMTQAIGMAPDLASLVMYVGATDTAIIGAMTTHSPLPTTIGCSWGWTPADNTTLDPYFQKMAAQGQNFFAASGDNSNWSASNEAWPADDANVVSVGGTDLVTASAAGPWKSETAWSDSGGGISPDQIPIPAWQQLPDVINSSNQGSTTLRNGPDVSANADFTFYTCADQTACQANQYGGTSFAAPMWAGYIALVNQQLANLGQPPIGFLNPTIYAQNVTSAYKADFHDITSGTSGSYSAVTGYDLVTGWGSPNGAALINALAPQPATSPTFGFLASPGSSSGTEGSNGESTNTTTETSGSGPAVD